MSLHYILDGYNLIKQTPSLTGKKLKDSREKLIHFIRDKRPQGSERNAITIVFDGASNGFDYPTKNCAVTIIFTRDESADAWIKRAVEKAKEPKKIVVVTNDKEICFYVRSFGARLLSVKEFVFGKEKITRPGTQFSENKIELSTQEAEEITEELRKIWLNSQL
ncbi:MAG: NYN domain-containing protein [Candidatus Omnitrophota bacterium]